MIKLFDDYFIARIDRALDDAEPLDGFTAWYVRHRPVLREYYEKQLELELELRFPENEFPNDKILNNFITHSNLQHYRQTNLLINPFGTRSTAIVLTVLVILAVLAVILFLPLLNTVEPQPNINNISKNTPDTLDEKRTIDLAELVNTITPLTEMILPTEASFGTAFFLTNIFVFEFPVEPIIDFTDQPLESTLIFLETAGIVHSSSRNKQN